MLSATNRQNTLQLIRNRELNDSIRIKYALKSNLDYKCISNLGLFSQLEHSQSINCIQWNESGSTLVSVSEDHEVILWDPFLPKVKTAFKTLHHDEINSVKFMPGCNDDVVATGAGDESSHTYNVTTGKQLSRCICSEGEIKCLAVANDSPSIYWCASDDGCISQHDMRMSHKCPTDKSKTTLVTIYDKLGYKNAVNCLDINQLKTEQLAVGADDHFVRLYDRRMIQSLSSFYVNYPSGYAINYDDYNLNDALQYFVPGHIRYSVNKKKEKTYNSVSYLAFSPDGQELLVSYEFENIYLFNLLNRSDDAFFNIAKYMEIPRENIEDSATDLRDDQVPVSHSPPPDYVEQLKAIYPLEEGDYTAEIVHYNKAISIHKCGELFFNRAEAYIKRDWQGDFYAALKDYVTALKMEPNPMKAHFRLAEFLFEMDKVDESKMYLDHLIMKYPSYKTSSTYKSLYSDLLNAQSNNNEALHGRKLHSFMESIFGEPPQMTYLEKYFRRHAQDYHGRYYGHYNYLPNIKEANFFGSRNQFIVAGSDDGCFFVWEKNTENNLVILQGDNYAVNCIQPHPSEFLLATSGMDYKVKLWSPLPDDMDNPYKMNDYSTRAALHQEIMIRL